MIDPSIRDTHHDERDYAGNQQAARPSNTSGIIPKDHKVLVLPDPSEEKTAGGIIIPDAVKDRNKFATMRATLLAVGSNAFADWGDGAGVEPGARILMAQYAGARTKGIDGADYILMNDEDVIAEIREPANV